MKTMPVEALGERFAEVLATQDEHETIQLTKDDAVVGMLVKFPGRGERPQPAGTPVFGAGRGTLAIVTEDEEHLKDFAEYME